MPQRFLRPGITNSDAWNAVSFEAQSFYVRILTLVDDYGRYDGRVAILHSHCFALRPDIKPQRSAALRSELHNSGLIMIYEVDGKEFLQVAKWQERTRGPSRFPEPPQESAGIRSEPLPNPASLVLSLSHRPESSPSPYINEPDGFCEFWAAYPKKVGKGDAEKKFKAAIKKTDLKTILAAIESQKQSDQWTKSGGQFVPNPSTWLNQGRWQDVLAPPAAESEKPAARQPFVSELKTVLEAKKAQRDRIFNRGTDAPLGWTARNEQDRQDYKLLNREIAELIDKIGATKL